MANKGTRDNPLTREDVSSLIRESKSTGKKLNLGGFYFEDHINLRLELLNGANLSGADLLGAFLLGADLRGANLSGAKVVGTNLIEDGVDLRGAIMPNG